MMLERAEIFREANERVPGPPGLLAAVIGITSDMLAAAQAHEWASVTADEARRRAMLDQCFAEPVKPEYSEVFAEALAVLLHMNEELTAVLMSARKTIAEEGNQALKNGPKLAHYLEVQS